MRKLFRSVAKVVIQMVELTPCYYPFPVVLFVDVKVDEESKVVRAFGLRLHANFPVRRSFYSYRGSIGRRQVELRT